MWTTDTLPDTQRSIPATKDVRDCRHLKGVDIADLVDNKVSILSGSDTLETLCPLEMRSSKIGQPYTVWTLFGWTIMEPLKETRDCQAYVHFVHVDQALGCNETEKGVNSIQDQLERLYNSELSEFKAYLMEGLPLEDRRANAIMDYSVKQVGGHY